MEETHFAKTVAWLLRAQALLAGLGALIFGLFSGTTAAMGVLGGGFLGIALTAVAALRIGMAGSKEPQLMVGNFYRAMALKLILAVVLFVIVAKWFTGIFVPVVTGYAATVVAYWLAMWRLAHSIGHQSRD